MINKIKKNLKDLQLKFLIDYSKRQNLIYIKENIQISIITNMFLKKINLECIYQDQEVQLYSYLLENSKDFFSSTSWRGIFCHVIQINLNI